MCAEDFVGDGGFGLADLVRLASNTAARLTGFGQAVGDIRADSERAIRAAGSE